MLGLRSTIAGRHRSASHGPHADESITTREARRRKVTRVDDRFRASRERLATGGRLLTWNRSSYG